MRAVAANLQPFKQSRRIQCSAGHTVGYVPMVRIDLVFSPWQRNGEVIRGDSKPPSRSARAGEGKILVSLDRVCGSHSNAGTEEAAG